MAKLAHKSFIWSVYVAPEARGGGVGYQIMGHALEHAATVLRARQVNLSVNTKNSAAVALYKKLAFVEYGLERDFLLVGGVLQDEYQMVCHVASAALPSRKLAKEGGPSQLVDACSPVHKAPKI